MDYTFLKTVQFESEGRNAGPTYKKDKTYDLEQEHGDRWVRRGVAYQGKPEEAKPAPKAENSIEDTKPQDNAPTGPQAVHRGAGTYGVMDGDAVLLSGLTREQAEHFNSLDDDTKAKVLAEAKAVADGTQD